MRWGMRVFILTAVGVSAFVAWTKLTGTFTARFHAGTTAESKESRSAPRIFAGGIVEGTHREISLQFDVPGRIKAVYVREGDDVKEGDVLAELESDDAELRLAEAGMRLKMALAERDQLVAHSMQLAREFASENPLAINRPVRDAESLRERGQNSGRQEEVSHNELELMHQKRDRDMAQSQSPRVSIDRIATPLSREEEIIAEGKIALADAAVRRERLLADKVRLRAPTDGIVLRAVPQRGELTGPTSDGELFIIVNRDATKVRAFVEELDAMQVNPGQRALVSAVGKPDQQYLGIVRTCSPDVRPKSHRHLKPGERLDVRVREVVIELGDGSDLLVGLPVEVFFEPPRPPAMANHRDRADGRYWKSQ